MKKLFILGSLCLGLCAQVIGQDAPEKKAREVSGTIISTTDNLPVIGAAVVVKGTMTGTVTDVDGKFKITVPAGSNTLVVSFIGMQTQEIALGDKTTVDVKLEEDALQLDEVVVTALGINREKRSLGYASQQVDGEAVSETKSGNFVNQLSGKVAGVQVKTSNNFGGSTNVVIRGATSLTGNNQALFIVDGIPIDNSNTNSATRNQSQGAAGYDFGNAVADINPNDIESINVLKGAAATVLYGSRAANGVVIITTKKGSRQPAGARQRLGVELNSNVTLGFVDKKTFPTYQDQYGQGYGPYYDDPTGYFYLEDIDGDGTDDLVTTYTEDASYGPAWDASKSVYNWSALIPESPNYHKATPWLMAENGPITFFETAKTMSNSVAVTSASDKGSMRVSYQKLDQTGIMPNMKLSRNNFSVNGEMVLTDKFSASATANYVNTQGKGRNVTGYASNYISSFRQWWALNVDVKELEEVYDLSGRNATWNPQSTSDPSPLYWNNPYFERYHNFETDQRERFFGNVALNYQVTEAFKVTTRFSSDTYSEIQEERLAVGSVATPFGISRLAEPSGYARFNRNFTETNIDLMGIYNKDLSDKLNLNAIVGSNIRRTRSNYIFASTNGGLIVPDLYALSNSATPMLAPIESAATIGVNGVFASVSVGFDNTLYVDATARMDASSTLPLDNNKYFYPGAAVSYIFSNKLKKDWLDFGKVRVNYAQVGNDAPWGSINDVYATNDPFGSTPLYSVPNTKNNPDLLSEKSRSMEAGLEMIFLKGKAGFDVAYYKTSTINQIFAVAVSPASGYSTKFVNAGEIVNRGIEVALNSNPYKTDNFRWDIRVNWARNRNEVVELFTDETGNEVTNLQLGSFQGGITLNATKGQPYGTIQGTDYVFVNGQKVVKSNGKYQTSPTKDNILGDINPDWNMGVTNAFSYKNWRMSFLIDWQKGGDIFSLDQYYGQATGLYENTVYTNDLGNPVRNSVANGGGAIFEGVDANGNPNTVRADGAGFSMFGYAAYPNVAFVYDASYIKLRELVITYTIPTANLKDKFISGATFSIVGNNLWILHKNMPYADPEAGTGSGNLQGWQSGVMPTTRNIGFTLGLQF